MIRIHPLPCTRTLIATIAVGALAIATPAMGAPAQAPADRVPGQVVVGLRDGAAAGVRASLARRADVRFGPRIPGRSAWLAHLGEGESTQVAIARLEADPTVRWAEPNYVYRRALVPDDPLLVSQWGLINAGQSLAGASGVPGADINAPAAWDLTTGSDRVMVAVVDTGVDATHPDLAPNVGVLNPGEAGGGRETNGIDDDGNGLVDDWRGWDFVAADADPQDEDPEGHGTLVAGVLGARGNDGAGFAGVSWSSRILPVRGLNARGAGTNADLAAAITYSAARGARILNASFSGPGNSQAIREAIESSPNVLVVVAAGNEASDNDRLPVFPCSLTLENVVCVAATDQSDRLAPFSNRGVASVDLAAPGKSISGPRPGGGSGILDGTSFAAPHVAGAAALVLAANPTASTRQLRGALLAGVDPLASLSGLVGSGGRLDAFGALTRVPAAQAGPGGATGPILDATASGARLTGSVPASSQRLAYYFEYGPTSAYGSVTPTRPVPPGPGSEVTESIDGFAVGARIHARLVVAAVGGVTLGGDQSITTAAPLAPVAAAVAGPPVRVARPRAKLRRIGRSWFVSLRLAEYSVVRGVLQRRLVKKKKVRARQRRVITLRTVRGLRRRGYAAGVRRRPLGRLAPGRYRLTVKVTGARGRTTIKRSVLVRPRAR